jgi:hypothetical protein
MSDIEVGVKLLEYAGRFSTVIGPFLQTAVTESQAAAALLGSDPVYRGRAGDELAQFFSSYVAHAQKIAYFVTVASKFLGNAFQEFDFTDSQLAAIVESAQGAGD